MKKKKVSKDNIEGKGRFVTLRKRALKNSWALFLDYYVGKRRKFENLKGLTISFNQRKTPQDKEILEIAKNLMYKKDDEILKQFQSNTLGEKVQRKRKQFLIPFFDKFLASKTELKPNSLKKYRNTKLHLIKYGGDKVLLNDISPSFLDGFRSYLLTKLSQNSANSYFGALRSILNRAVRDDILNTNPMDKVRPIGKVETDIVYLEEDELKRLYNTDMPHLPTKNFFLFGCYTGLRPIDLRNLTWNNIEEKDGNHYLKIKQEKTKQYISTKIHKSAVKFLPEKRGAKNKKIFDLYEETWTRTLIKRWVKAAGINKNITTGKSRHTFATRIQTTKGDLYLTAELLGHSNTRHTRRYAKVIDKKKIEAIDDLPSLD